ncbi:MAG: HAD family hydrolase [Lachnospiraceae bacterium]|nr:HAD family hydrolase [Lachnospiraceae bacterium]
MCIIDNKRPAVFLDRDGVLTVEKGYVTAKKDMEIFSYVAECIKQIHLKGYYAIVVTNQSGVARGLFTEEILREMNNELIDRTGVDAVFYCPHHPEGKIKQYRCLCHCRKPETGMFEMACKQFNIDIEKSYMVGDRAGDIVVGKNLGVKTVLVDSGYGVLGLEQNVKPDYILDDLRNVINILE